MQSKEVLEAAQLAVLFGANAKALQFCHRPMMTPYEGYVIQPNNRIYMNGLAYLAGEEAGKLDEVAIEMLLPYVVAAKCMESAAPREWAALFLLRRIEQGLFGEAIAESYQAQSDAVKWAFAYAVLEKEIEDAFWLFQRTVLLFFPEVTMYVRSGEQQIDVIVHIPGRTRETAQPVIRLAAQLLLPFYYATEVVAKEPPAMLHAGMPIGNVRLVDEQFELKQQWNMR